MPDVSIEPISAAQTRPLRRELLRPFQPPEALVYFGDDAPDTLHAGAFVGRELVGVATVCRDPMPGAGAVNAWRLRGMAIRPEVRGQGYGRALLERCLAHVGGHGGEVLWCNGRVSAAGFYRALGFEVCGEEFEVEGTGPHYLMRREVTPAAA